VKAGPATLIDLVRRAGPFVIVLAAGIWLWTVADDFAITTRLGRAGPDLWPKVILVLMIGAAIWGIAEALFKSRPDDEASILITRASRSAGHEEDARHDLAEAIDGAGAKHPRFAVAGIAAMLGYVVAIPYVGFVIATFLLLLAIMLAAGYTRLSYATAISLIGAFAFFIVFQRIVYVSLPHGVGPFKELTLSLMALLGVR
jgi:putative tricarboxylic transport membrane protein